MTGSSYRIGPYVLDRSGYRVMRGAEVVALTPKLLDLFFHLADNAGALVTKEQLLDALWPGANVTDNALAQAVSELRQALGDDAGSPQFIKTIARRGYRFIGTVEPIPPAIPGAVRTGDDRDNPPTHDLAQPEPRPEPAAAGIVVMDFTNVTGDADLAWLSSGAAETITSDLRSLECFRVIDRQRVAEAIRATDGSLRQVVDGLNARLAVVGSFQRQGPSIRITARLLDVASGEALADAKVDGPLENVFDLQDQVVAQFARELGITRPLSGTVTGRDTPSLEAYRAFTEGWLRLESLDLRELPQAVADLERAIARDPRYAQAYAGLASGELALYESTRSDNAPRQDLLNRALEHAHHAVGLAPSLAEAHATLALVLVSVGKMPDAAAAARRAVAIEPNNWRHHFRLGHASWGDQRLDAAANTLSLYPELAFAHFQMAMVHVARANLPEAETILRQGAAVQDRQIDRGGRYPALGLHWLLGLVRLAQDDVEEAIAELDREEALASSHRLYGREFAMNARLGRAAALLRAGRAGEAIAQLYGALELYPDHAQAWVALSTALGLTGDSGAAAAADVRTDAALVILSGRRPAEAALVRAQRLTARGDFAGSATLLQRFLNDAPPGFAGWMLPVDPFLHTLARRGEFAAVLTRLAARAR